MAATTVAELVAKLRLDAKDFTKKLDQSEGGLKQFGQTVRKTGMKVTAGLTLPLLGAGAGAFKAAMDFEASMTKIESLVGLSSKAVEDFTEDVKRLSAEAAQSPKELADAMFFITSAGLRGAEATQVLESSAKAAAVGLGEAATVADLATSALNAYGAANLSAVQATDVMVAAVREGKLEATELGESMGRVLPLASALGVEFHEVGASFAALSRTGTNAAEAATQIRGILASLLRPTKQAKEALAGMGLSAEGLRKQIREDGLLATLKTLADEFKGNEAAAASVFGNIRALSGVLDLMGANVATTEQIFANMADTTGTLDTAFDRASQTTRFKLDQAMTAVKLTMIELGEAVIPVLVPIIEGLSGAVSAVGDAFGRLPGGIQAAVVVFGLVLAAIGPIIMVVGQLTIALGFLGVEAAAVGATMMTMLPILALVAVATAAVFAIWNRSSKEAEKSREEQEQLTAAFAAQGDEASTLVADLDAVIARHEAVALSAGDAAYTLGEFAGAAVMLGLALDREVADKMADLGMTAEEMQAAVEGGSDEFQKLEASARNMSMTSDRMLVSSLRNADEEIRHVTSALADQYENEKITREELVKMLDVLDETSDAYDHHNETLDETAKKYMEVGDNMAALEKTLGVDVVQAAVSAAS